MTHTRKHLFIVIALILIGVGTIFFVQGLPLIVEGERGLPECGKLWRCIDANTEHIVEKNGTELADLDIEFHFKTVNDFSVDNRIDYIISTSVNKPNVVQEVHYMIAFTEKDYSGITNKPFLDVKTEGKEQGVWIELQKSSDTGFHRKGFFTIPVESNISFMGFVVDNEGEVEIIPKSEKMFEVKPFSDLIVVSARTLLGLTWISVAFPFVLLGSSILLRMYMRQSQIDKWFKDDDVVDYE